MQGDERPVRPPQQPHQLGGRERPRSGSDRRSASTVGDEIVGQRRQGDPQPADPPRRLQPPGRRAGVESRPQRATAARDAEQVEIDGDPAADGHDERAVAHPARRAGARRSATPRADRRAAERPRGRPRAVGAAARTSRPPDRGRARGPVARASSPRAVIGRLCSSTIVPSASIAHSMSCGPPNVRLARRASRASWRRGAPGGQPAGRASSVSARRPRSRQRQLHAVDLAAHQAVGPAGDGGHDEAVGAAGDRVGAEQHAAPRRPEERLHEHGDRGLAAGAHDLVDGGDERFPTPHVEHGREHPGHRLRATVLGGRRRAHDERQPAVERQRAPRRLERRRRRRPTPIRRTSVGRPTW